MKINTKATKQNKADFATIDKRKILQMGGVILVGIIFLTAIVIGSLYLFSDVDVFGVKSDKVFQNVYFRTTLFEKEYDGTPISLEILNLPEKTNVAYSYVYYVGSSSQKGSGSNFTEPGEYELTAILSKRGYRDKQISCTCRISKMCTVTFTQQDCYDMEFTVEYGSTISQSEIPSLPLTGITQDMEIEGLTYQWVFPNGFDFITQDLVVEAATEYVEYTVKYYDVQGIEMETDNTTEFTILDLPFTLNSTGEENFWGWCSAPTVNGACYERITRPGNYNLYAVYLDDTQVTQGLSIEAYSNYATVTACTTDDNTVYIPDYFEGVPITEIADGVFEGKSLSRIVFPSELAKIGANAFKNCVSLSEMSGGEKVTEIGAAAFEGCSGLVSISGFGMLENIGERAFFGCDALQLVSLGSLSTLGAYSFANCFSLATISIDGSLDTLSSHAFSCCFALTTVYIDAISITTIEDNVFDMSRAITLYYKGASDNWLVIAIGENNNGIINADKRFQYKSE